LLSRIATLGLIRPETFFAHCERAAHQRFGFVKPVGRAQQLSEIAELDRNFEIVRSQTAFTDRERAAQERFGFGETVGVLQQMGEVVEPDCNRGMIRPQTLLRRWLTRGA
jgi:hypothetical protein